MQKMDSQKASRWVLGAVWLSGEVWSSLQTDDKLDDWRVRISVDPTISYLLWESAPFQDIKYWYVLGY